MECLIIVLSEPWAWLFFSGSLNLWIIQRMKGLAAKNIFLIWKKKKKHTGILQIRGLFPPVLLGELRYPTQRKFVISFAEWSFRLLLSPQRKENVFCSRCGQWCSSDQEPSYNSLFFQLESLFTVTNESQKSISSLSLKNFPEDSFFKGKDT